jgi:hypothetical protein
MKLSLRAGALLAAGALAVHELRYTVGYGDAAAAAGHGYLLFAAPLVAVTLALACGVWLARVGRADPAQTHGTLTWLRASASLAGVYVVQETIEGLSAGGRHPGLLAHGGWIALPLAFAVGALVALLLRGARAADQVAAVAARPWSPHTVAPVAPLAFALPRAAPAAPRGSVLARRLAGRAPPTAS